MQVAQASGKKVSREERAYQDQIYAVKHIRHLHFLPGTLPLLYICGSTRLNDFSQPAPPSQVWLLRYAEGNLYRLSNNRLGSLELQRKVDKFSTDVSTWRRSRRSFLFSRGAVYSFFPSVSLYAVSIIMVIKDSTSFWSRFGSWFDKWPRSTSHFQMLEVGIPELTQYF